MQKENMDNEGASVVLPFPHSETNRRENGERFESKHLEINSAENRQNLEEDASSLLMFSSRASAYSQNGPQEPIHQINDFSKEKSTETPSIQSFSTTKISEFKTFPQTENQAPLQTLLNFLPTLSSLTVPNVNPTVKTLSNSASMEGEKSHPISLPPLHTLSNRNAPLPNDANSMSFPLLPTSPSTFGSRLPPPMPSQSPFTFTVPSIEPDFILNTPTSDIFNKHRLFPRSDSLPSQTLFPSLPKDNERFPPISTMPEPRHIFGQTLPPPTAFTERTRVSSFTSMTSERPQTAPPAPHLVDASTKPFPLSAPLRTSDFPVLNFAEPRHRTAIPSITQQLQDVKPVLVPVAVPDQKPILQNSQEPKTFRCYWGGCTGSFSTRTGLATHCSSHIEDDHKANPNKRQRMIIECKWNNCGEQFASLRELSKHLSQESHVGQTPFLSKHEEDPVERENMRKKKKYLCSIPGCGKAFSDSSNRKKHERTHDANRERFYCAEPGCHKSYSTKTDLNIHLKVHRGEFPHKCTHPNCTKAFVRLSELYAHERTHDNILPHVCSICEKRFREKSRLRKHEEMHKEQLSTASHNNSASVAHNPLLQLATLIE